jgi:hypothetical protein
MIDQFSRFDFESALKQMFVCLFYKFGGGQARLYYGTGVLVWDRWLPTIFFIRCIQEKRDPRGIVNPA